MHPSRAGVDNEIDERELIDVGHLPRHYLLQLLQPRGEWVRGWVN